MCEHVPTFLKKGIIALQPAPQPIKRLPSLPEDVTCPVQEAGHRAAGCWPLSSLLQG